MECEICSEEVQFQKILTCGQAVEHSFCVACLKTLTENETGTLTITCPKCRAITTLLDGKLENLQTVYHPKVSCVECSENNPVSKMWWCDVCMLLSCGTCAMRLHRGHACNLFDSSVVNECSTYLLNTLKELRAEILRIKNECESFQNESGSYINYVTKIYKSFGPYIQTQNSICAPMIASSSSLPKENMERKMKLFCKIINAAYTKQLLCTENVCTLINMLRPTEVVSVIYKDSFRKSFKALKTISQYSTVASVSTVPQELTLTKRVEISASNYGSLIDFCFIPDLGFCVTASCGILLFSAFNGALLGSVHWGKLLLSWTGPGRIAFNEYHNFIFVICECGTVDFGLLLDVPDLKLVCKLPLQSQRDTTRRQQTVIGFTGDGLLIVANKNFVAKPIDCYNFCFSENKFCDNLPGFNLENKDLFKEPMANLVMGHKLQSGQRMYILTHTAVYQFLMINIDNIYEVSYEGEISFYSHLSGYPLFWNYKLYIFDDNSWSMSHMCTSKKEVRKEKRAWYRYYHFFSCLKHYCLVKIRQVHSVNWIGFGPCLSDVY